MDAGPFEFRRYREEPQGSDQLVYFARVCGLDNCDGWLGSYETRGLSTLMGKEVIAARVHGNPRSKLFHKTFPVEVQRLSVMVSHEGVGLCDDDGAEVSNILAPWVGLTVLYRDRPTYDQTQGIFSWMVQVGCVP